MKRSILILLCGLAVISAQAQFSARIALKPYIGNYTLKNRPDTISTSSSLDTSYLATGIINSRVDLYFEVTNTKISGTIASSNFILQGSFTGTASGTWYTVATNKTENPFLTDTVATTNATQSMSWYIQANVYPYYRIRYIAASGTQSSVMTGSFYIKKYSYSTY